MFIKYRSKLSHLYNYFRISYILLKFYVFSLFLNYYHNYICNIDIVVYYVVYYYPGLFISPFYTILFIFYLFFFIISYHITNYYITIPLK